jgi:glycosyltransferase involved in cell wall biosynthesis
MPRIHIITPNVLVGDAIAQDAVGMLRVLRKYGLEAYLYAEEYCPALRHLGGLLDDYEADASRSADDILIYHHAVGWRTGVDLFRRSQNRRVLKYHNITPSEYFREINQEYANSCVEGALHTRELLACRPELALADSSFNARELIAQGADPAHTHLLPPFHDVETLRRTQADLGVLRHQRDDIRNILFVGRVAPNKGHVDLIETFANYHHYLNPRSQLFIVGNLDPRLEIYTQRIRTRIDQAGLAAAVHLTGKVSSDQLKGYYLIAHAFLCTSHHEGFCVPVAEAMAFQIPCVAWAVTGVASTLGRRALAWENLDHALLAESLHHCLEHRHVAEQLAAWQLARYRRLFATAAIQRRFLNILRKIPGLTPRRQPRALAESNVT